MKTYEITLRVMADSDPADWDWAALLDLAPGECILSADAKEVKAATEPDTSEVGQFVARIAAATDAGIKEFGTYFFHDNGPGDVMDIDGPAAQLRKMPPEESGQRLEALALRGRPYKVVADAILGQLDSQPEDWWEACCAACPTVEY